MYNQRIRNWKQHENLIYKQKKFLEIKNTYSTNWENRTLIFCGKQEIGPSWRELVHLVSVGRLNGMQNMIWSLRGMENRVRMKGEI